MSISDYRSPVAELLTYGDCRNYDKWPNYVRELDLKDEHIPELIQMAIDAVLSEAHSDSKEVWAPVHAWRALGQLKAVSAVKPLFDLLNEDWEPNDWLSSELPTICTLIGPDAIPTLKAFLENPDRDFHARIDAASSLESISQKYPETRDSTIEIIAGELAKFQENNPSFNGFLISELIELQAIEKIDLIEAAFKANRVDLSINGNWDEVQVEFGLKSRDEVPRRKSALLPALDLFFSDNPSSQKKNGFGSVPSNKKKKKSKNAGKRKKKR